MTFFSRVGAAAKAMFGRYGDDRTQEGTLNTDAAYPKGTKYDNIFSAVPAFKPEFWAQPVYIADQDMAEQRDSDFYEILWQDPFCAGLLEARLKAVSKADVVVHPKDSDPETLKLADDMTIWLNQIENRPQLIEYIMDARIKATSFVELVWEKRACGNVVIAARRQDKKYFTWHNQYGWTYRGNEHGLNVKFPGQPLDPQWYVEPGEPDENGKVLDKGRGWPEGTFLVSVNKQTVQRPWGWGIGEPLYWVIAFKKRGISDWQTFTRNNATPMLVGYDYNTAGLQRFVNALREAQGAKVIGLHKDKQALEYLDSGVGGGEQTYKDWTEYWDRMASYLILGTDVITAKRGASSGRNVSSRTGAMNHYIRRDLAEDDLNFVANVLNYGSDGINGWAGMPGLVQALIRYNRPEYKGAGVRVELIAEPTLRPEEQLATLQTAASMVPIKEKSIYAAAGETPPGEGEPAVKPMGMEAVGEDPDLGGEEEESASQDPELQDALDGKKHMTYAEALARIPKETPDRQPKAQRMAAASKKAVENRVHREKKT